MDVLLVKNIMYFVYFVSHATNIDMAQNDGITISMTGRWDISRRIRQLTWLTCPCRSYKGKR